MKFLKEVAKDFKEMVIGLKQETSTHALRLFINRRFLYLLCTFIVLLSSIMIITYKVNYDKENDYEEIFRYVYNIVNQEPINGNVVYDEYMFYLPKGYEYYSNSDTVLLSTNDAIFTMYFGTNAKISINELLELNSDLELLYNYIKELPEGERIYYFVWEYENDSHVDYIEVLIGIEDMYIVGIFPKQKATEYIMDMSYILNSVQITNTKTVEEE